MNDSDLLINVCEIYLTEKKIITPHLQCERVSQELSYRLNDLGIKNRIRVAEIDIKRYDGILEYDSIEHHFLMIGTKILDATASQFKGMPKIYFGSLPMWYKCY